MSDALNSINLDQLTKTAMGGADTSWIKPTVDKLQTIEKQKEAEQDPLRDQLKTDAAKDKKEVDTKYAGIQPVELPKWDAAKEAAKRQTDPIQAFGSFGSVFAMAASAFTHTPIINALNGSAAAMQAIKKKDEDGYNQAYDAWKENTKIALDRHNMQHQDYEDAFDKMKTDMAEGQAMLTATSAKYGDQAATLMNEAGLYEKLGSLQEARATSARGLLSVLPDLQMKNLEVQSVFALDKAQGALTEAQKSGDPTAIVKAQTDLQQVQQHFQTVHAARNPYGSTPTNGLKTSIDQLTLDTINEKVSAADKAARDAGHTLSSAEKLAIAADTVAQTKNGPSVVDDPETLNYAATQFRKTGQMPALGNGLAGAQARQKVLKEAARQVKEGGGSVGDDLANRADIKADGSSLVQITKTYDSANAFENTALANMKIAESLMEKGAGGSGGTILNRWIQAGRKATGDPDVAAFDQAITTVGNEVAKINSGSTGSQGATVSAVAEAQESLNRNYTPDQIRDVFKVMRMDMENKKEQYDLQRQMIKKRISGTGNDGPANSRPAVGSVIQKGGKSYRITGYDPAHPDDPEVEVAQ